MAGTRQVWLVYYEGHDDGVHPESVFSSEELAKAFIAQARHMGVRWEYMPVDLDPVR